jgi:two-component system, NtrC family, nitrogen regulation sensor histidine kinase NtrY
MPPAFETRLCMLVLAGGLPSLTAIAVAMFHLPLSPYAKALLLSLLTSILVACAAVVRNRVRFHLLTLVNLTEAVRLGEYMLRGSHASGRDAMGTLVTSINAIAGTLQQQRLETQETRHLLDKVLAEVDVAILAFDESLRLRLANNMALRLLALEEHEAIGKTSGMLGMDFLLSDDDTPIESFEYDFPGKSGTWRIQRSQHLERGNAFRLLFIVDLRAALRAEELNVWKRLTQVISHEVNNSITPIISLSATVQSLLNEVAIDDELAKELNIALELIAQRSQHLHYFVRRYAEMARLPAPNKILTDISPLLSRLPTLVSDTRVTLDLPSGPVIAYCDPVQLDLVLVNLMKNAREAMMETGVISVRCRQESAFWQLEIRDEGMGVTNPGNLFVPFYSTKKNGNGIGLIVSRQIVESHGGSLGLRNRSDRPGCIAELRLPKPTFMQMNHDGMDAD